PLHSDPAPVDEPHLAIAALVRRIEVLGDDRRNVTRRKRVQVEGVLDRDLDRLVVASQERDVDEPSVGGLGGPVEAPHGFSPLVTCSCQCWKLRRSSPASLHCQKVAARSKKVTSTTPTFSARALSATFCATICRTNGIGMRPSRCRTSSVQRTRVPGMTGPSTCTRW